MSELASKKCRPCAGGATPLAGDRLDKYLSQVLKWGLSDGGRQIFKEFVFKDFKEALEFVNQAGRLAEDEGHHPDILIYGWNKVKLSLTTHAIGGLSENDFILAAKIDKL